jgi:hypothetical protein
MRKLFRAPIPDDLATKLCISLGFPRGLGDYSDIRRRTHDRTLFEEAISELSGYYVPCWRDRYLKVDMSYQNGITILRHVLRERGRDLIVRERKSDGKSITTYRMDTPLPSGTPAAAEAGSTPVPPPNFTLTFD